MGESQMPPSQIFLSVLYLATLIYPTVFVAVYTKITFQTLSAVPF